MSRQRLEAPEGQHILEVLVAQVRAPAAPEVHQVGTPFNAVHIRTVLQAAHEGQPGGTVICRME